MHFHAGVNKPRPCRSVVKAINGDSTRFTVTCRHPTTDELLVAEDIPSVDLRIVVSETRFTQPIWQGAWRGDPVDLWLSLDENRPGLVHVTLPCFLTSLLRRGSYIFSVVASDGSNRVTQATGYIQVEYEASSPLHDIPYRDDGVKPDLIRLSPEFDSILRPNRSPTYNELVAAVREIGESMYSDGDRTVDMEAALALLARVVVRTPAIAGQFTMSENPTYTEVLAAIRRMAMEV